MRLLVTIFVASTDNQPWNRLCWPTHAADLRKSGNNRKPMFKTAEYTLFFPNCTSLILSDHRILSARGLGFAGW